MSSSLSISKPAVFRSKPIPLWEEQNMPAGSHPLLSIWSTLRVARIVDTKEGNPMAKYIPSPRDWVREQVDLYESSGGTKGTTLRDTGLPVVIMTHRGNKTGEIRK